MKALHIVIMTGIVLTLSYNLAYASTDLQIRTDKINYFNSDKPVVTISGDPNTTVELEITDSWGNIVFSHGVEILPTGNANYTLDITSYEPGVYSAQVSMSTGHVTAKFSVGLTPTGAQITLNLVKYSYLPGDNMIILGAANSNSDIKLSLIEPNGTVARSLQTFSDKTGHFSFFDFRIPNDAVFGKWKVQASMGLNYKSVDINVGESQNNTTQTPNYGGQPMKITIHVDSPLKQFKSGIRAGEVQCKQGYTLIAKKEGGLPACVTPDTAEKLCQRGWELCTSFHYPPTSIHDTGISPNGPDFKLGPDLLGPIPHRLTFFMNANSTAKIFVQYTSDLPNTGTTKSWASVYVGKTNYTPINTTAVTITADPGDIPISQGSNTTVVYTVSAKEVKGIYWISLAQICGVMPIFIDYPNPSPSDIPVPMGAMHCPVQFLNAKVLGVTGGTAEYRIGEPYNN